MIRVSMMEDAGSAVAGNGGLAGPKRGTRDMTRVQLCLLAGAALLMGGCADTAGPLDQDNAELSGAFSSMLMGFQHVESSFDPGTGGLLAWSPGGHGIRGGGGLGFCGGGLGGSFLGGFKIGRFGIPDLSASCTFDAASGRVVCAPETRHGLTIQRSVAFRNASGAAQSAWDSVTTNSVNVRVAVSGTTTRRGHDTTVVEHTSDRTVSGLVPSSTQRTVNGTSAGRESTTGTNDDGSFTALRIMGDTTTNVVIPVRTDSATYPISGRIVRAMQVTVTKSGGSPTTSTRREVITYNGTATATVVITKDGVTQNCTLPLPRGRLTCE